MRWTRVAILLCLGCSVAFGQPDERRAQVSAAKADALDSLKREVLAASVTPDLSIKDVVDRTGGTEELSKTLADAEQIGGTRWLDDQTCQIRVEIGGKEVAQAVTRLAEANPQKLPLPVEALRDRMATWQERTFTATGKSTGARGAEDLRPPERRAAWRGVSDEQRRQAIETARRDAAQRVLESLSPIDLVGGRKLAEALAVPEVNDAVQRWLMSRPITSIEFRDDRTVRVAEAASGADLWPALRAALEAQKAVPVPTSDAEWDRVRGEVLRRIVPAVGSGAVLGGKTRPTDFSVVIPKDPPGWVDQQLSASGTARGRKKLMAARDAEEIAVKRLRTQLESLTLAPSLTIGQAAQRDPTVAAVIDRTLLRARTYKVDYRADGSADVRVGLDLSEFWAELQRR